MKNQKYIFSRARFASSSLAVRFAPTLACGETMPSGLQKLRKYIFGFVFFLAFYLLFFTTTTSAQFNIPAIGDIKPTISLSSNPVTPLPNSTIVITANLSGVVGNGNSNYTWFLNGARQANASGTNKNNFTFRVGAVGEVYRISVNVATQGGENLSENLSLTVSDVDMTWTANTKVPTQYNSKSLPTQNSIVTISALPFMYQPGTKSQISSGTLIYNWRVEGKLDKPKSGINKQSYVFRTGSFLGNNIVQLEVKTQDGSASIIKNVSIPVVRPQILLYFREPKTSMPFGLALKNVTAGAVNFNFIAQPYFFTAPANNLNWQWFINNAEVRGENEKPWLADLNLADNFLRALSAQIKVTANNPNKELESSQSVTNLEIK